MTKRDDPMEKKLKETLTKALDKLLQKTLEDYYNHSVRNGFLKNVKSPNDFLLGVIVGDMMEGLGFCTFGIYKRYPKKGEFDELLKMIHVRSDEIRKKTLKMLQEQHS